MLIVLKFSKSVSTVFLDCSSPKCHQLEFSVGSWKAWQLAKEGKDFEPKVIKVCEGWWQEFNLANNQNVCLLCNQLRQSAYWVTHKGNVKDLRIKYFLLSAPLTVLLQHGADPNIRNTDGKSALDLADSSAKAVLTGQSLSAAYCSH